MLNKYDLAAIVAIHRLDDGEYHKLPVAQQRELFGFVAIGRKSICFDPARPYVKEGAS